MTVPGASTGRKYERGEAGPGRQGTCPEGGAAAGRCVLAGGRGAVPVVLRRGSAVFAAYAVLLLATLLVFGPVSDFLVAAG
jgi:hypothetical protein